ncbi:MAG: transcriptional regulator [Thermoprotei archaeon]|nr:MAG: transcriptional regulator [Thermoprotei archaeon]
MIERLDRIYSKLLEITEEQHKIAGKLRSDVEVEVPKALDVLSLLKLPDHLRKTAMALDKLGEGTADDVARITGRERAVESGYLNQLARMGYVRKKRVGKKVMFTVR